MSRQVIDRRQFLTLPLALFLAPLARAQAAVEAHRAPYGVDVSLLYGALTYRVEGTLTETIDRPSGRYDVTIAGEGDGIANRIESVGILRQGRWAPLRSRSFFSVKGRESRSDIAYDHARRSIEYHFKGETFFFRRLRVADDVQKHYRAELIPFELKVAVDAETRKLIAQIDLTRFSSWAKQDQPALITFGPDRRPEHLSLPMILGTSVQIRLKTG